MLEKTKQTNAKMLMNKSKRDGFNYVAPESLGIKIGENTRIKKEEEKELRS